MTWMIYTKLEKIISLVSQIFSHHRMNIDDSNKVLDHEIIDSKALLNKNSKTK